MKRTAAEMLTYCQTVRIEVKPIVDSQILFLTKQQFSDVNERTLAATLRHQATNYDRLYTHLREHCGTNQFRSRCYRIIRRKVDGAIAPIVNRLISTLGERAA